MKELSIEEKAQAYDEAWHKAKRIINVCVDDNTECRSMIACIQQIFPELKGSEDEKIREAIVATIHLYYGEPLEDEAKEMIAWLEKQEQKPTDEDMKTLLRTEYEKGRADAIVEMQKPAWSEEDEHRVKDTIYFLDTAKKHYASTVELDACIDWLKALKQRIE